MLEQKRLEQLNIDQPDIFLPVEIDVTLEDVLEQHDEHAIDFNSG